MRSVWLVIAGLLSATSASAQRPAIQATPLPPLQQQLQQQGAPPIQQVPVQQVPLSQVPLPSNGQGQNIPGQPVAPPGAAPPVAVDRANIWLPAGIVRLQALDKVNAQTNALTIKVGQSATFGSLTILAKACVVRPTDQPADAAAYLAVVDSHPDSAGFNGWMLANEPSVSMMESPVYDLRVTGCT